MKDFIQDIKTINKVLPIARTSLILIGVMAALEIIRQIIFAEDSISGVLITFAYVVLSIGSVTSLTAGVSGQKYVLLSTLPIKTENVPRMVFRQYELTALAGFLICIVFSLAFGRINEAMLLLMVGVVFALVGYILLLLNATPEYVSGLGSGAKMIGLMAVYFVIGGVSGFLSVTSADESFEFVPAVYFTVLGILLAVTLAVRHFAFKKYIKIVRIIKKEVI